jgi:hypothetical protein
MGNPNDDDFIFGRLQNELKQIEEQKRRAEERRRQSETNWFADLLRSMGQAIGKIISYPFELLGDLIDKLFGK